jgi:hypothetical protein
MTTETNSVVHAAAEAVSRLCQVSIAFDEVDSTGTLEFDYRIEMICHEKIRDCMIEEATIRTNVNNFRNRNSGPIESLREQCRLIAKAFGCEIKVGENGYDCPHLSRMFIFVGKPKEATK